MIATATTGITQPADPESSPLDADTMIGDAVGAGNGDWVGVLVDGDSDGALVVGYNEGEPVGALVGMLEGAAVGAEVDGVADGT